MSSRAQGSSRKTAARKRTGTTSRKRKSSKSQQQPTLWHDALILVTLAAAVFVGLGVFWPEFSQPAGEFIHRNLKASLGAGMFAAPFVVLLAPAGLLFVNHRKTMLKALAWAFSLMLLASLVGGLFTDSAYGGILGDACANLGYGALGGFYPVLVVVIALLVIIRLAGRSLIFPLAKGTYKAAVSTTAAAVDFADAVSEKAEERKVVRRERKVEQKKQASEEEEKRAREIIAAEIEAADAPDDDSPVIRDEPDMTTAVVAETDTKSETQEAPEVAQDEDPTAVKPLGRVKDAEEISAELEDADNGEAVAGGAGAAPADADFDSVLAQAEAAARGEEAPVADNSAKLAELAQQQASDIDEKGQLGLFASTQAGYQLPPLAMLRDAPKVSSEEEYLEQRSRVIEKTLKSFNIDASCVDAVVGPRVTRYELKIGPGINVSKIHNLADNLALELAVKAVRIEAPIPGKSAVGIEVPNASPQLVTLKSVLESPHNQRSNHPLTVGLGRDIAGHAVVANLAKMPHLLVAGATGSGKSVCLNGLIVSLLMRNAPDTMRMILIDPKRVEMSCYENVPHLACPVVNDVGQAQSALKWVVAEMDRRYRLLEKRRARNIAAFNEMAEPHERLPFIVVVIDELADLMMLAGQVIEKLICRIAQLSRAVGIHLVIATQRPDVKVITGTIKANVPSRIAFATVSHIDSRTILDGGGADKLLGSGDMLFAPIGENKPIRVQGCFLSDDEIDEVVEFCAAQAEPQYDESITSYDEEKGADGADGERDELFGDAKEIVESSGRASISYLQRRLRVGYNRAARVMEELEDAGVVSEPDHAGNRKVL